MPDRTMFRGDSYIIPTQVMQLTFPDGSVQYMTAATAPPQAIPTNVTGWKFWFTAKNHIPDADNLAVVGLTSLVGGGITIVTPLQGKISSTIPPLATIGFADSPVVLEYDIQGEDTLGNIFTVERGTLTVTPDITRAIV